MGRLHLGGLWAPAFVQPLLDLLEDNAEFWSRRSCSRRSAEFTAILPSQGTVTVAPVR